MPKNKASAHLVRIISIAAVLVLTACTGGTTVELANRSARPLQDVSVEFTGGATPPQSVQSGGLATVRFVPTGESHLEIRYRSPAGQQFCLVDTYLEPSYRADFRVELWESSCKTTRSNVKLPPYLGAALLQPPPNNSFKPTPLRGAA